MRYPLWAFFFVLVMPIFTAHALLVGKADLIIPETVKVAQAQSPTAPAYWTHRISSQ